MLWHALVQAGMGCHRYFCMLPLSGRVVPGWKISLARGSAGSNVDAAHDTEGMIANQQRAQLQSECSLWLALL